MRDEADRRHPAIPFIDEAWISVVIWGQREDFQTNVPQITLPQDGVVASGANLPNWKLAALAAESKKATDVRVLDLRPVTSFTDYFVICSVNSSRQGQAVCDEVENQLKEIGERPVSVEGYDSADWVLMDYGDFVLHVFSESARSYYDLERLWRHAEAVSLASTA